MATAEQQRNGGNQALGCIHTDSGTGLGICVWVTDNKTLHVFQQQTFASIQVL